MARGADPASVQRVSGSDLSTKLFIEQYAAVGRPETDLAHASRPFFLPFSCFFLGIPFVLQGRSFFWTWSPHGLHTHNGGVQMAGRTSKSLPKTSKALPQLSKAWLSVCQPRCPLLPCAIWGFTK